MFIPFKWVFAHGKSSIFNDDEYTLGAHREKLVLPQTLQLQDDAICYIDAALHHPDIDVQTQREGLLARQQQV